MDKKISIPIHDDKTAKKFSKDPQTKSFNLNSKNCFITDKGIKDLFNAPSSKFMKEIDLSENYSCITDETLSFLAEARYPNSITKITLKDTDISDVGIEAYISSPNFNNIEEINLYGLYMITDQTLICLSDSYYVSNLKKLNLKNTSITDRGFEVLTTSPNSAKLIELDISENYPRITDKSLMALSVSEFLLSLKILRCMGNKISDKGIHFLLESRNILDLEELDISDHTLRKNEHITDVSLKAMAYSHYLRSLKILNLRSTMIASKGLIDFFSSYNCQKIEVFKISNNPNINDIVIMALMESDNLYSLKKLYINDTSVSSEVINNLKQHKPLLDIIY